MLDERTNILLKFINEYCKDQSYKVLDIDELKSAYPERFKMDREGISQIVQYLKNREYIAVKYSDNEQYCLSPLPKGRQYFEAQTERLLNERLERNKTAKIVFWASLIGAFLGSMITFLVSMV